MVSALSPVQIHLTLCQRPRMQSPDALEFNCLARVVGGGSVMSGRVDDRSDGQLVLDAAGGDEAAFAELVYRHRQLIGGALGRVPERLRGDAQQEALEAVWAGLSKFKGQSSVSTWMYSVVLRRSLNVIRNDNRARLRDDRSATSVELRLQAFVRSPEIGITEADAIRQCMSALAIDELELLDRFYGLGTTVEDLANELFVSEEAIRKRLERTRGKLKKCLRRRGGGHSD